MAAIKILVDQWFGEYHGGDDSDGPYSYRGHRNGSVTVEAIQLVEDGYKDLDVPFVPVHGKDYYVLWGSYTTGDSFGSESGNYEIIDVYSDAELAYKNRELVDKASREEATYDLKKSICTLTRQDGSTLKFSYFPWHGYFESLDYLEVTRVRLR